MILPQKKELLSYFSFLVKHFKSKMIFSMVLMIFLGLTRGLSLMVLVPILNISESEDNSKFHQFFEVFLNNFGIPFNLQNILILFFSIICFYEFVEYFKRINDSKMKNSLIRFLRKKYFNLVLDADWHYLKNQKNTNVSNNLVSEIENIGFGTSQMIDAFGTIVMVLIYVSSSMIISGKMTVLAVIIIFPMLLLHRKFNQKVYENGQNIYILHQTFFNQVSEFLDSIKLAKSHSLEDKYTASFGKISTKIELNDNNFEKLRVKTSMYYQIGTVFLTCLILFIAIRYIKLPILDLCLMIFIASKILPSISTIINNYQNILNMLPAFSLVNSHLHELEEHQDLFSKNNTAEIYFPQNEIRFENIKFRYKNSKTDILKNLNCVFKINKTTAIIGQSGIGKSTLIDLFLGLLQPQSGKIMFDNRSFFSLNIKEWRKYIAYIPQEGFLFHASVRENLLWTSPNANEEEITEALQISASSEFVSRLPQKLETIIGDKGILLSGGERQRLVLARAILRKPKFLILDEATSALDDENEKFINESIKSLKGKLTIIIIAHRKTTIETIDERIYL